jgi:hypothetical protein
MALAQVRPLVRTIDSRLQPGRPLPFLEEGRATSYFTEHAELLDSLEAFLAKVYRGGGR